MALIFNTCDNTEFIVGVIAGTPTDTRFGVQYLQEEGIKAVGKSISDSPQQQTEMQARNRAELTRVTIAAIELVKAQGAHAIMIYCNSLSGSIDLNLVKSSVGIPVVCPLDVYEELIGKYRKFGLLAANCQSCSNIERFIIERDSRAKVIGVGNLQIVEDIEKGYSAKAIIRDHALVEISTSLRMSGVEVLILGCTHFDYFYKELQGSVCLDIFEPSEKMVAKLLEGRVVQKKAI